MVASVYLFISVIFKGRYLKISRKEEQRRSYEGKEGKKADAVFVGAVIDGVGKCVYDVASRSGRCRNPEGRYRPKGW
jgi:hypothetical protein